MSQQLQYHHTQQQYVHYAGPPGTHHPSQIINGNTGIAPQDTTHHPQPTQHLQQQQQHAGTSTPTPLVATGDWTKDLVHLAKTAELKKHALTLQLHTAHILSAHASLQEKSKVIQDIREQRNKSTDLRNKLNILTEGEYAMAKNDVDRLRQELGQAPLPTLQSTLDEKTNQYLNERRLTGNESQQNSSSASTAGAGAKRSSADSPSADSHVPSSKRPRGRPKGSKNRNKEAGGAAAGSSGGAM
ncbi:hypothetical protein C0991_008256 [Blastosporella zonata]|nr:hypothetical protein C0991_008256 [Blastosporella zonata]